MEEQRTGGMWVTVALLLLLLPVCAYVVGYFALCVREEDFVGCKFRVYKYEWQARLFIPAAALDRRIREEPRVCSYEMEMHFPTDE